MLSEKHIKRKPYIDHAGKYQDVLWTTGIRICFVFHLFLQMGFEFTFLFLRNYFNILRYLDRLRSVLQAELPVRLREIKKVINFNKDKIEVLE